MVTCIRVVKKYIAFGDVQNGVNLVHWDNIMRLLTLVAADFVRMETRALDIVLHGASLTIVCADASGNVKLLKYAPLEAESYLGKRLVCAGDFHVGQDVHAFESVRLRTEHALSFQQQLAQHRQQTMQFASLPPQQRQRQQAPPPAPTHPLATFTFGATLSGALVTVVPLADVVYRRLQSLHTQMTFSMPQHAGLNPRAYRLYRSKVTSFVANKKNVVDFDLLRRFLTLDVRSQTQLARLVGETRNTIVDDMLSIQLQTRLFSDA
jgi:cleavage and polyadenylation specificity factor subunit 1